MPAYRAISNSEFNARYNKLATYLAEEINANKLIPQVVNEVINLFSSPRDPLTTQADLDRKLFVLNRDDNRKTFLHKAVKENNLRMLIFLKITQQDINRTDGLHRTPLYVACEHLKLIAVHALLYFGADPNKGNAQQMGGMRGERTPLNAIIHSELIGPSFALNPDNEGIAAHIVRKLITAGADVNLQTGAENLSALHRVIIIRKPLILQEIINSGKADYDLVNVDKETILHMLVAYRHKDEKEKEQYQMQEEKQILDLLIPHINSIDEQDIHRDTALHKAVINSNVDVVEALYKKDHLFSGVEKLLTIQNNKGNTVIHEAIEEAQRGPKILTLLLRVATEADLTIENHAGETAKEMATRLFNEAKSVEILSGEITFAANQISRKLEGSNEKNRLDLSNEINQLKAVLLKFDDHRINNQLIHAKSSKAFTLSIENLFISLEEIEKNPNFLKTDIQHLVAELHQFVMGTTEEFFEDTYLNSLKSVQQTEYLAWKNEKLELPSSFPNLEVVDPNLLNAHREQSFVAGELAYQDGLDFYKHGHYNEAIIRLRVSSIAFRTGYPQHRALAKTYLQLGKAQQANNENVQARENFKKSIEIFNNLKEYDELEGVYQSLAETYIKEKDSVVIAYETENRNKLSLTSLDTEKLQSHLALATLYQQIKELPGDLPQFLSKDELSAYESFHYKEAYKLTQGKLDNQAHIVLQSEFGIAQYEKLGTYNIRQCVAVIVYDPLTQKVVLSHFDKFSGPLSFIDQIRREFPGESTLDLYLSGGRDREDGKQISDNNIDQVLKQVYVYKERFNIKAADVGDNHSPEAIVFDVESQTVKQAMPNHPDSSLNSRMANFLIQERKDDYLLPPNVVDFTKSEADRTKSFTPEQKEKIKEEYTDFANEIGQTQAWNHDSKFYLLMEAKKDIVGFNPNFNNGLLKKTFDSLSSSQNYQSGLPLSRPNAENSLADLDNLHINDLYGHDRLLNSLPNPNENQANRDVLPIDDLDAINVNDLILGNSLCMHRSKREIGIRLKRETCAISSEELFEKLKSTNEETRSEILERISSREIGGAKQEEIATLVHNQETTNHLHKANEISLKVMDGLFYEDALAGWLGGNRYPAIQLGGLKGSDYLLGKLTAKMDAKGLEWLAEGKLLRSNVLRSGGPFIRRSTSLVIAFDLYDQAKALQKNGNNTDALVGVVSDGVQLGADLIEGGVEVVEISSETFAALGVSAVTAPGAMLVGGVVMLGDKIYAVEEKVDEEDHLLHLSTKERWKEGIRAFANLASEFQKQLDEINEYARILVQQFEFLKNHTDIKHVIFPAIEKTGNAPKVCKHRAYKGCRESASPPIFATIKNNLVYFKDKLYGFELNREELTAPAGSEFLCVPTGKGGKLVLATAPVFACDGAAGLTKKNTSSNANTAFFNLAEGEDHAAGFMNSSNIFMVNAGAKDYEGGDEEDIFIINAKEVVTAVSREGGIGGLDGGAGLDSLLLQGFQPAADRIEVNLGAFGYLCYGTENKTLAINNIEKLFGGNSSLAVTAGCESQEIHLAGGPTLSNLDTLLIPNNSSCAYDMKMYLQPLANVNNQAIAGNFTYYILLGKGIVSVNLTTTEDTSTAKHQFILHALISDVSAIQFSNVTSADKAPRTIQFLTNKSIEDSSEEFTFELTADLTNQTIYFIDNAELRIGNKNLYFFQKNLQQNVTAIMNSFAPIASRLNLICSLMTENNEQILIGHNGHEIMQNNPKALRTHLNGNGGEGVFVIQSGMPSLRLSHLPIPEVVMYRRPEDKHIDTLDFRPLAKQIQASNSTAKLVIIPPNAQNHLGDDLLLLLGIVTAPNSPRLIEVATVRLKDARLDHWYKHYLHILLNDNLPQQIAGRHSHLYLKPIPLEFDAQHEIASVGVNDIEENTDVIIPHAYQTGVFFHHNKTNLVWTNMLSNRTEGVEPFTLILNKFFQEPKLQTLSLQFTDEKIALNNKLPELKTKEDFAEAKDARLASLREEFLAIINAKPLLPKTAQNVTDIEVNQDHYSSNDINATSIKELEDILYARNETKNLRRRRAAELKITFIADEFHDQLDKKKAPRQHRNITSNNTKQSLRSTTPASLKQNTIKADITNQKANSHFSSRKPSSPSNKRLTLFNPMHAQQVYVPHSRENKQKHFVKILPVMKLDNFETMGNLHKIENSSRKYLHSQSLLKARLAGNNQNSHQHTRQQSEKSLGISQVTAPINLNATLLLFQAMSRVKHPQPLNSETKRKSEKVERLKQKVFGRPIGLRI